MRPPEFTGGNIFPMLLRLQRVRGFNEAAGIHRRKRPLGTDSPRL